MSTVTMDWRQTWREGIQPLLTEQELLRLYEGLMRDDPAILQGATTSPPPLACVSKWSLVGACPIGYAGWKANGLENVKEVEEFFAKKCFECDMHFHERGTSRHFLDWVDETPRAEMRRELSAEIAARLESLGILEFASV